MSRGGGPRPPGSAGGGGERVKPPLPALKSLLLCDQIIQSADIDVDNRALPRDGVWRTD